MNDMERGTLWQRVRTTTEKALGTGALMQFPTSTAYVEEGGVRYFVRVLEALKRKDEARKEQQAPAARRSSILFCRPSRTWSWATFRGTTSQC